jgi:drug/metabolite transporter (DMT)-like permease
MLAIGNGIVIWVEQALPSAMVAIMISANPIWFVVLDKRNWRENLTSTATNWFNNRFCRRNIIFGEQVVNTLGVTHNDAKIWGVGLLVLGPIGWAAGSLFSKYKGSSSPARVNTGWQMLVAGIAFLPASALHNEFANFDVSKVPAQAWMAVIYLIFFGSIAAFTAYVWLLQVRPATQVSTHSYVNPVIAVLLGVLFASEHISWLQIGGLVIILLSVLLINLAKYRKDANEKKQKEAKPESAEGLMCEAV